MKNVVQIYHPLLRVWVLLSTVTGRILRQRKKKWVGVPVRGRKPTGGT